MKIAFFLIVLATTLNVSAEAFDPEREGYEEVDPIWRLLQNSSVTSCPSISAERLVELKELNAKIAATPGDASLYCERGHFYFCEQHIEKAEENYTRAIELDPNMASAFYHRGKLHEYSAYEKSLALGLTCSAKTINNHGVAEGTGNANWEEAIKFAKMALMREPGNQTFRQNLGIAHFEMGCAYEKGMRFPKAAEQYQLAVDADPLCLAGKKRLKEFELKHCITTVARKDYPCDALSLAEQTKQESKISEFYTTAIKDFESAEALIPKNSKPHIRLAKIAVKQKKHSLALEEYSKAISLDGDTPQVRMCRAALYERSKDYSAALADITKAIEDIPKSKEDWLSSGPFFKKLSDSEIEKEIALQKKARDTEALGKAHYLRGRIMAKQQNWSEALRDLDKAITANKSDLEYFSERAKVHKYLGNQEEAAQDLLKVQELEPLVGFITRFWGPIESFEENKYTENISSQKK